MACTDIHTLTMSILHVSYRLPAMGHDRLPSSGGRESTQRKGAIAIIQQPVYGMLSTHATITYASGPL